MNCRAFDSLAPVRSVWSGPASDTPYKTVMSSEVEASLIPRK